MTKREQHEAFSRLIESYPTAADFVRAAGEAIQSHIADCESAYDPEADAEYVESLGECSRVTGEAMAEAAETIGAYEAATL